MTRTRIAAAVAVLALGAACASADHVEQREPLSVAGEEPDHSDRSATARDGDKPATPREKCSSNCAPDFSVTTFTGERFALAQHHGKIVVLNFWESW